MTSWPPTRRSLGRPAYRSLADAVVRAVNAGALRGGDRLPTHRDLAYDLGVSVQTVSRAYAELIRAGVLVGEVGRGTFVRAAPAEPDAGTPFIPNRQYGAIIDLSILKPVFTDLHHQEMARALAALAADLPGRAASSFRPSAALGHHLPAAVDWLRRCGVPADRERVLLTNGNTSAMTIALMTAASPGDLVVSEALGHHTLKTLAAYLGMRLEGIAVDGEGLVPEALEAACRAAPVRAVYLMPTGLSPTATTMSPDRREAIVAVARRHDLAVVESDAWGPLAPGRPPPVAALAPERTFYFTGLTKCLMPGARIGFLVTPPALAAAAANRHLVTNWMATPILAEIAMGWIADGTADALVDWQRRALEARNALARRILGEVAFAASPAGMHLWLPLPPAWGEADFVAHARFHGVAVAPGSAFALTDPPVAAGVRVCLGAESEPMLERGLTILRRLILSRPEPALLWG